MIFSFVFLEASTLINAMDNTVDPCEDFFEYACGNWNRKNIIPEDKSSFNTFEKLYDELQIILKGEKCLICNNTHIRYKHYNII